MIECRRAAIIRSEGRLVGVTVIEPDSQSLNIFDAKKIQFFVVNKVVENILQNNIIKAKNILSI